MPGILFLAKNLGEVGDSSELSGIEWSTHAQRTLGYYSCAVAIFPNSETGRSGLTKFGRSVWMKTRQRHDQISGKFYIYIDLS